MREFDDASLLASNLPREPLNSSIANLQKFVGKLRMSKSRPA